MIGSGQEVGEADTGGRLQLWVSSFFGRSQRPEQLGDSFFPPGAARGSIEFVEEQTSEPELGSGFDAAPLVYPGQALQPSEAVRGPVGKPKVALEPGEQLEAQHLPYDVAVGKEDGFSPARQAKGLLQASALG